MPHHHRHPRLPKPRRSPHDRAIETVNLLRQSGKITTVEELIVSLKEMGEPDMAAYVSELRHALGTRSIDIDTAIAALRAHVLAAVRGGHEGLIENCTERTIGLLFPLPPHVHEEFLDSPNVTLMVAPGHRLPPHLRRMSHVSDPRKISNTIDQLDVIVFEGFEDDDGTFYVEAGVAAILNLRLIPVAAKIVVHPRPHQHDDDVEFDLCGRPVTFI